MRISVGIDIAKEIHWVTAIDADGVVRIDRKLLNTPTDIASLADQLADLGGVRIGLDVIGGIAGLAEAILAEAGFTVEEALERDPYPPKAAQFPDHSVQAVPGWAGFPGSR